MPVFLGMNASLQYKPSHANVRPRRCIEEDEDEITLMCSMAQYSRRSGCVLSLCRLKPKFQIQKTGGQRGRRGGPG